MKRALIIMFLAIISVAFIHGEKLGELPGIFKPTSLALDNDQMYITEGATISIFTLKDFKLIKKFGKGGEGPKEFKLPPGGIGLSVLPLKDSLLINSIGKVSYFSKKGEFIKEFKTAINPIPAAYQPVGKQYVGLGVAISKKRTRQLLVKLFDENLKFKKEIKRIDLMTLGSLQYPLLAPVFYTMDNKIVVGGERDFIISVFDKDGNLIKNITRNHPKLKMTEKYKESIYHFYKTHPQTRQRFDTFKKMITFSDEFPAVRFFYADNNKIYVQTYREKDGNPEFIIYDINGKYIKSVYIPFLYENVLVPFPATIKNNTFYQLIENEDDEQWELHGTKIE